MQRVAGEPSSAPSVDVPTGRWPLVRWFIAAGTFGVPQAAAPIAFSFVALQLTGDATGGAAVMLAMTLAQVVGAIPVARIGRNYPVVAFLKLLVGVRSLALVATGVLAACNGPFIGVILLAAAAGSVNSAAFGYLRSVLNHLTPASDLPRSLGIASTLNEATFVLAPVLAAGVGAVSPVLAVLALAMLGALPMLLVPPVHATLPPRVRPAATGRVGASLFVLLWIGCAAAGGAAIAAIEIGAVALALRFGYEPMLASMFTVPLCLAAVAGGIWVSVRNRRTTQRAAFLLLSVMTLGSALVALELSVAATVLGCVMMGLVMAPLGTHYSLALDALAPPDKRAEVFALLRTANSVGVIVASATLTAASLSAALVAVACLVALATLAVGVASSRRG